MNYRRVLVITDAAAEARDRAGAVVDADAGGVAYAAHVGGAVFGMLTARLFERHAAAEAS